MKHSIRARFTFLFLSAVAALLLAAVALNTFGLERFYRAEKVKNIERAYQAINAVVVREGGLSEDDTEELQEILNEYSGKYNITIAVMDSATSRMICTSERGSDSLFRRAQRFLFDRDTQSKSVTLKQSDDFMILSAYDEETNSANIDALGYCGDNQTVLIMSTPLANLKESVQLANRFLAYVGLFTLVIGIVVVSFMTRQVTRPIQQLAALSEKMGRLEFGERYTGNSEDEIGVLGGNMNIMAGKLEETITELQKANASLKEDIRRKEEIDEMRKEFIANVSHELKTPIALIQGYAEGLADGLCEDPESRKEYLDVIIDESEKMNSLVRQLLTLSRLESGAPDLSVTEFDLAELIRGVLANSRILAEEKGARIIFEEEGPLPARADEFRIEEVVTNYVSNAVHHVNEGGEICVTAERTEGLKAADAGAGAKGAGVKDGAEGSGKSGARYRVHVFNTGSHIPEMDIAHVWDKFYKVDKAHSRAYGGTGIGLSIVQAVMEAHHMGYGVENRDDGVDFWFETETAEIS